MKNYNISGQPSAISRQEELGFTGRHLHSGFANRHFALASIINGNR